MSLFLQSSCVLCDASVSRPFSLCEPCEGDLPKLLNACKQCGLPLENLNAVTTVCGECIKLSPVVDYTLCLYHYQAPVDYLITTLKYKQQLPLAKILGELLLIKLLQENIDDLPDCIIPVPLHKKRLVKRGLNQSLEIARPVARKFKIPIDLKLVHRARQTLAQADLDAAQRKRNVNNCFEIICENKIRHDHVVIIDDVITTGSTINALAKVLKQSGVKKVGVWSVARAVLGSRRH